MTTLQQCSLAEPQLQQDPYEFYGRLRNEDPVHYAADLGFYIVSRYRDCQEVLARPDLYSSKLGFRFVQQDPPEVKALYAAAYGEIVDTLSSNDPPSHTRFRRLVATTFNPIKVSALIPAIDDEIAQTLDCLHGRREMDAVRDFAVPIPLGILADQLGVPRADMDRFKRWSDATIEQLSGLISPQRYLELAQLLVEMQHYFAARIEDCKRHPRDDILGRLVTASLGDERPLTTQEMLSVLYQLLTAGHETTASAISSGVLLLCRHPEVFAALRQAPDKCAAFAEEVLRLEAPVQGLFRMTTQDVVLGGVAIAQGAALNVRYASANRDEERFAQAAQIDLERPSPQSHLSFGHGIHVCIGARLSRKEIELSTRALVTRLKSIRIVPGAELTYAPSLVLRGLRSLPVELEWL